MSELRVAIELELTTSSDSAYIDVESAKVLPVLDRYCEDGWLKNFQGTKLIYIPERYRRCVWHPYARGIIIADYDQHILVFIRPRSAQNPVSWPAS